MKVFIMRHAHKVSEWDYSGTVMIGKAIFDCRVEILGSVPKLVQTVAEGKDAEVRNLCRLAVRRHGENIALSREEWDAFFLLFVMFALQLFIGTDSQISHSANHEHPRSFGEMFNNPKFGCELELPA